MQTIQSYKDATEGATFRIVKNPPKLIIEINDRVVAGMKDNPVKAGRVRQGVIETLDMFLAANDVTV